MILSSGFNTRKQPVSRPNGFRITQGKNPGEIAIRTDSEPRSFYMFEMTLTPEVEESWEQIHSGTRCSFTATGLESGERYHFRVSRNNKNGSGVWSNILNAVAI